MSIRKKRSNDVLEEAYAIIRRCTDDDREWLDLDTVARLPEQAQACATAFDQRNTFWAKANPIVRLARIKIEEITP